MSLNTEEINLLVYKYLEEAGFSHSAFCFGHESLIARSAVANANSDDVPPGALVALLQKAAMFMEIERELESSHQLSQSQASSGENQNSHSHSKESNHNEPPESLVDLLKMQAQTNSTVNSDKWIVSTACAHKSDIHALCWNPSRSDSNRFLTCGSDGYSRMWKLTESGTIEKSLEINHVTEQLSNHDVEIICGAWHPEGSFVVTGLSDGRVCMWDMDGELLFSRHYHDKRVHGVAWNPSGRILCSYGADGKCIWYESEEIQQIYTCNQHIGAILDVAWRDDYILASASADSTIVLYGITGQPVDDADDTPAQHRGQVLQVLTGHKDEVNSIRWDFARNDLFSVSDDLTVRVWNVQITHESQDGSEKWVANARTKLTLDDHSKEISCLAVVPKLDRVHNFATGSYDGTICLWDAQVGTRLRKFSGEIGPVSAIDISPCGQYLACSCLDHIVACWDLSDTSLCFKRVFDAPVMGIQWDRTSRRLAAFLNSGEIKVCCRNT